MEDDSKLTVDTLLNVVSKMGEEAQRLKEISNQMQIEKEKGDPTGSLKVLEGLVQQLGGENKLFDLTDKLKSISAKFDLLSPEEKREFEQKARSQLGSKMDQIKKLAGGLMEKVQDKMKEEREEVLQPYSYLTIGICTLVVLTIFGNFLLSFLYIHWFVGVIKYCMYLQLYMQRRNTRSGGQDSLGSLK